MSIASRTFAIDSLVRARTVTMATGKNCSIRPVGFANASAHERGEPEVAKLLMPAVSEPKSRSEPTLSVHGAPNFTTQHSGSIAGENSP
jgi:hypothetical protein